MERLIDKLIKYHLEATSKICEDRSKISFNTYHDPCTKSLEQRTGSHLNAPRLFFITSLLVIGVPSGRRMTIEFALLPCSAIFQKDFRFFQSLINLQVANRQNGT